MAKREADFSGSGGIVGTPQPPLGPTTTFCTAQKTGLVELAEVAMRSRFSGFGYARMVANSGRQQTIFMTRVRL